MYVDFPTRFLPGSCVMMESLVKCKQDTISHTSLVSDDLYIGRHPRLKTNKDKVSSFIGIVVNSVFEICIIHVRSVIHTTL